jgi:hypothetical protein
VLRWNEFCASNLHGMRKAKTRKESCVEIESERERERERERDHLAHPPSALRRNEHHALCCTESVKT